MLITHVDSYIYNSGSETYYIRPKFLRIFAKSETRIALAPVLLNDGMTIHVASKV
jgi:hypothetical protein